MKTWREHIMNINWKVRLKSGPFWLGVASAVIMWLCFLHPRPVRGRAGDHRQPDHRGRAAAADYPAAIGIISDPTTKGVKDSQLAMTYDAPKDDGKKSNKNGDPRNPLWVPGDFLLSAFYFDTLSMSPY